MKYLDVFKDLIVDLWRTQILQVKEIRSEGKNSRCCSCKNTFEVRVTSKRLTVNWDRNHVHRPELFVFFLFGLPKWQFTMCTRITQRGKQTRPDLKKSICAQVMGIVCNAGVNIKHRLGAHECNVIRNIVIYFLFVVT